MTDPVVVGREWPSAAAPEAFHGLAGDVVRALEPYTEADPHALLSNVLTAFGNVVGYGPHFKVGQDRHGLRLYVVQVGATGHGGRKGLAHAEVMSLFDRTVPDWATERVQSGLSTGEGLIWAVRDPIHKQEAIREKGRAVEYQEVMTDAGVTDKRLLAVESEFARTLKVMGRDGNTLSACLRQAWDSGNLRVLTRTSPAKATGAHVSVIGHITRQELLRYLDSTEAANGFGNRFLWMAVRRSKDLPEGGSPPMTVLNQIVQRLREAVGFAASVGEIRRDQQTREMWASVYPKLVAERPGLFGALTGRAEAQVMRLACIYALLDSSAVVNSSHLLAALAFWEGVEASVRYVFGDATGDPVADTILRALRTQGAMTQTGINSGLFGRNVQAGRIAQALGLLLEAGLVGSEPQETEGRAATLWRARGLNSCNSSNSYVRDTVETVRVMQ
jgi:hypothetical protein